MAGTNQSSYQLENKTLRLRISVPTISVHTVSVAIIIVSTLILAKNPSIHAYTSPTLVQASSFLV
jgi:hypothetical protein